MIEPNTPIEIIASAELTEMGLNALAGRSGLVTEELTGAERRNRGYMVFLHEDYQDEHIWFIPEASVRHA